MWFSTLPHASLGPGVCTERDILHNRMGVLSAVPSEPTRPRSVPTPLISKSAFLNVGNTPRLSEIEQKEHPAVFLHKGAKVPVIQVGFYIRPLTLGLWSSLSVLVPRLLVLIACFRFLSLAALLPHCLVLPSCYQDAIMTLSVCYIFVFGYWTFCRADTSSCTSVRVSCPLVLSTTSPSSLLVHC